jgi:hypothetical protein
VARLAIAKGFLGEYAKLDKDVRPTAEPAGQNPQLPFAAWRTFLHPSQREIACHAGYPGPAQVTGGPGTGKTVTVLHRAAFLAARAVQVQRIRGPLRPPGRAPSRPAPGARHRGRPCREVNAG